MLAEDNMSMFLVLNFYQWVLPVAGWDHSCISPDRFALDLHLQVSL